ncbi:hypothetical protein D3C80_1582720 [compost metagenome]
MYSFLDDPIIRVSQAAITFLYDIALSLLLATKKAAISGGSFPGDSYRQLRLSTATAMSEQSWHLLLFYEPCHADDEEERILHKP